MEEKGRMLPVPDQDSSPYWEATKRHELLLQRCLRCGAYRFYPGPICQSPNCLSTNTQWVKASGRGTVYSFSVIHRAPTEAYARDVPYTLAIVQLAEGPGMVTNIVGCPPDQVRIGMEVQVVFDDVTPEITLPKFRPV